MSKWGTKPAKGMTADMGSINIGGELTEEQWRFGQAMERYKREHRCPQPDCRDVLRVLKSLGYQKVQV